MSDETSIRFECLRLAATGNFPNDDVMRLAKAFADFVLAAPKEPIAQSRSGENFLAAEIREFVSETPGMTIERFGMEAIGLLNKSGIHVIFKRKHPRIATVSKARKQIEHYRQFGKFDALSAACKQNGHSAKFSGFQAAAE